MKTFAYGVALGAGFMTGRMIYKVVTTAVLWKVFGEAGLDYIVGKGPKPDYMNKSKPES